MRASEAHIDAAFASLGKLATAIVRARKAHGLSAVVGQPVFAAVSQASISLVEARGHAVKGHRLLEPIAKALGLDIRSYGEERKDEGDGISSGG